MAVVVVCYSKTRVVRICTRALALAILAIFAVQQRMLVAPYNYEYEEQHAEGSQTHSKTVLRHIVVAHCKEDISWLDQFLLFEPRVCERSRFHIYSKCSMLVELEDTIPGLSKCSTLHTLKNFGTEEYAYLTYIQENYDNMPPMISFIQGGGITENPHIIFDIMENMPGLQYKSLSRVVGPAWHFVKYEEVKDGEKDILNSHLGFLLTQPHVRNTGWLSDYRGMFTVSRDQIREHSLNVYAGISGKIRMKVCELRNCCMETWFSSLFGCNTYFFRNDDENCRSGVYKNLANAVFDEDYNKDGVGDKPPTKDTNWIDCGDKMMFFAKSEMNGALICVRRTDYTNSTNINGLQLFTKMIAKDTWRPQFSNVTWGKPSQWHHHQDILDAQM